MTQTPETTGSPQAAFAYPQALPGDFYDDSCSAEVQAQEAALTTGTRHAGPRRRPHGGDKVRHHDEAEVCDICYRLTMSRRTVVRRGDTVIVCEACAQGWPRSLESPRRDCLHANANRCMGGREPRCRMNRVTTGCCPYHGPFPAGFPTPARFPVSPPDPSMKGTNKQ